MKKFPGEIKRGKYRSILPTDEQMEWFRKWFPVTENSRIAKAMGISPSSMHRLAREQKLTKSNKGFKQIKKRTAAKLRKKLERNGYYESLRGHAPCERARLATKALRAAGFHPLLAVKAKSPARYKRLMEKRSRLRKELVESEKRRQRLGLKPLTKLHLPEFTYTNVQTQRRYLALQRGYLIHSRFYNGPERFTIFYDDETERSALFEKNCVKAGFKVERVNSDKACAG